MMTNKKGQPKTLPLWFKLYANEYRSEDLRESLKEPSEEEMTRGKSERIAIAARLAHALRKNKEVIALKNGKPVRIILDETGKVKVEELESFSYEL